MEYHLYLTICFENISALFLYYFGNLGYIGPKKNIDAYTQGFKNLPSILRKNNTIGVQFHPEKSQHAGYNYLKNLFDE